MDSFYRCDSDFLRAAVVVYGQPMKNKTVLRLPAQLPDAAKRCFFMVGHDQEGAFAELSEGEEWPKK